MISHGAFHQVQSSCQANFGATPQSKRIERLTVRTHKHSPLAHDKLQGLFLVFTQLDLERFKFSHATEKGIVC